MKGKLEGQRIGRKKATYNKQEGDEIVLYKIRNIARPYGKVQVIGRWAPGGWRIVRCSVMLVQSVHVKEEGWIRQLTQANDVHRNAHACTQRWKADVLIEKHTQCGIGAEQCGTVTLGAYQNLQ
jgi:hypothetical protein